MYPYAAWGAEVTPVPSNDEFYYVTLTPYIRTLAGSRVELGPILYAVPVKFIEAQPRDFPSSMKSYVATNAGVSFPTMNGGWSSGYGLEFDVVVSTESVPQPQLIPVTEVNGDQSNQDPTA